MFFKILQNVVFLLSGQVVAKIVTVLGMIVLARRLGVEGFGMYGTVMTTLTLFATFADGGLNTTTIRDVARDYAKSDNYFSHIYKRIQNSIICRVALQCVSTAIGYPGN